MRHMAIFLAVFSINTLSQAQNCLVVSVTDGDTIKVRCGEQGVYEQITIRLAEIDAPERKQAFGNRAKDALGALCHEAIATIKPTTKDRYGRIVARVECRGVDANSAMVKQGMAWAYTKYQTDPIFPQLELQARAKRIGLWVDLKSVKSPVAPWEWRKLPKEER